MPVADPATLCTWWRTVAMSSYLGVYDMLLHSSQGVYVILFHAFCTLTISAPSRMCRPDAAWLGRALAANAAAAASNAGTLDTAFEPVLTGMCHSVLLLNHYVDAARRRAGCWAAASTCSRRCRQR